MKIPGIGAAREKMKQFKAIGAYAGANISGKMYDKAIRNFKVLGIGINSGMPIPKVVRFCEKFVKENKGDWKKLLKQEPVEVAFIEKVFARVEKEEYLKEDVLFIKVRFLAFLERVKVLSQLHFTSRAF